MSDIWERKVKPRQRGFYIVYNEADDGDDIIDDWITVEYFDGNRFRDSCISAWILHRYNNEGEARIASKSVQPPVRDDW